ncbi:hypothetical protein MVEN_00881600 [Mycena venus]|uniref:Uncharacterized protein n=1 Tax=Mycena venus TaxID=2733690 RepID=A0A8H6YGK2_9AGAR|nr:hypothetical protein MVEN_00881600 [Mycena venus]
MNGDLTLKVICFGQTPAGNDFEACCVDFDKNIIQAFQEFLRLCYSGQDTAALALPTTPEALTDDIPVHRVAITEPASEPENAKKSKAKSKSKSKPKQSKKKQPKSGTIVETNDSYVSPMASPSSAHSNVYSGTIGSDLGDSPPSSHCASPGAGEDDIEDSNDGQDDGSPPWQDTDMGDHSSRAPDVATATAVPPAPPIWPPGMTAPLCPEEAMAIATIERGGAANNATMAIDPQLVDLAPVSTPVPPKPRPTYKGSDFAPTPLTFRSPCGLYRLSGLFDAFRGSQTPQAPQAASPFSFRFASNTTPSTSTFSWSSTPTPPPSASPMPSKTISGFTSMAARLVTNVIGSHIPASPTPTPPVARIATPPHGPAPEPFPTATTSLATPPLPSSTPPAAATPIPAALEFPASRPQVKAPPKQVAAGAPATADLPVARPAPMKGGRAKKAPARKTSSAGASGKQAAAAEAKKVASVEEGVKKRGRPARKQPLTDTTNEVATTTGASTFETPDTASTITTPDAASMSAMPDAASTSASSRPTYVYSSTNNNRARAIQAAAAERAVKEKEAADAAAKQAAKGWFERTVDGATVVTLARVRKPARFFDGSVVQREVKGTRAKKLDPVEERLLAHASTKRKLSEPIAARKKRKV